MNLKSLHITLCFAIVAISSVAQTTEDPMNLGNQRYLQGKYSEAVPFYQQILQKNNSNFNAWYNLGAAYYKSDKADEALAAYDGIIKSSADPKLVQKAWYNKGVVLTHQKKLLESIEAYKKALRLDPTDEDARFNLQKALEELRKQQKQKKEQQKNKQTEQESPEQSPMNKKQIDQWLQSLRQKEQDVQKKMQQKNGKGVSKPEKDW